MDYQAAVAAEERAWTARNAIADASELVLVGGRTITSGIWAVRGAALGEIATGDIGAPVAGLLIGMYPGKLNDGEQDFIDRMRAEQMREAPNRVFTHGFTRVVIANENQLVLPTKLFYLFQDRQCLLRKRNQMRCAHF